MPIALLHPHLLHSLSCISYSYFCSRPVTQFDEQASANLSMEPLFVGFCGRKLGGCESNQPKSLYLLIWDFFGIFETVTNIRTWIISYKY